MLKKISIIFFLFFSLGVQAHWEVLSGTTYYNQASDIYFGSYSKNNLNSRLRSQHLFLQNPVAAGNNYSRGILSNNLYWNAGWWKTDANDPINGVNDFAAVCFENGGSIGLYTRGMSSGYYNTFDDNHLSTYW